MDRRTILEPLDGRIRVVGLGNECAGDDAIGVALAQQLTSDGVGDVLIARDRLENVAFSSIGVGFDHVLFVDAVDFAGEPGSVVLLDSTQIAAKFPQDWSHRLSLGLVAKLIQSSGNARCWLLGIQPKSLRENEAMSPAVRSTMSALVELIKGRFCIEAKAL